MTLRHFVLGLALTATLVGCAGPRSEVQPAQKVTGGRTLVRFWNGFSGPDGKMMEALVKKFNASQSEVEVRMQIIPWGTYYDKVTLGLAFADAPELFVLHAHRVPEYADHGSLADLGGLLTKSGLRQSDFVPRAWPVGMWKGQRYGFPLDCHPMGLYYNKKLFREAGVTRPPRTREEFVEVARRTKPKDGWGFAFTNLGTTGLTFMAQYDTAIFDDQTNRALLNDPRTLAALTNMESLITRDKIAPRPAGTDAWVGFQTGMTAMVFEGIYMMSSLNDQKGLEWGAAPVPQFGPKPGVWAGTHTLCIPRKCAPEAQEAAFRFAKFLSDNSLEWAKGGQVPVRTKILASPEFQKLTAQAEFAKQLPYIRYEPRSTSMNAVAPFFETSVQAILGGVSPPKEALDKADRRVRRVLAR